MISLNGKTAFITGAATGIGEGTARLFAETGARLALTDIDAAGVARVREELAAKGAAVSTWTADVRRRDQLALAVEGALAQFGAIDILVNNAGIYPRQDFLTMTEEQWDNMQEVNLRSMFHTCQLVLPSMIARRSGKIINISSVTFFKGLQRLAHYVASKGGVIGLTRVLAKEFGEHNVHVNCITPGAIEVDAERRVATAEQMAAIVAMQALERRLQPVDIARVCLFLATELSDGLTGQTINVDGGLILH